MTSGSKIEWTDRTWNPVTGCDPVSPGCAHCFAKRFAERFRGVPGHPFEHGFDLELRPERLDEPARWRKPHMVFVCSMSDLFHEQVPDEFIGQVWYTMLGVTRHTFQVLTKRPERMRGYVNRLCDHPMGAAVELRSHPIPNIWLGVSIENDRFVGRAEILRQTPAAVRFISAEPLLGPLPSLNLTGIDQLIVGGESGPGARPMHPDWARDLRDRCQAAGVAFFFKQWGEWAPESACQLTHPNPVTSDRMWRVGKRRAGRLLDGRTWDEYPR